jgi:hypothetical protein
MRGLAGMGSGKKGEKKLVVLVAVFLLYLLFISRQILTRSPKSKREVSYQCFFNKPVAPFLPLLLGTSFKHVLYSAVISSYIKQDLQKRSQRP